MGRIEGCLLAYGVTLCLSACAEPGSNAYSGAAEQGGAPALASGGIGGAAGALGGAGTAGTAGSAGTTSASGGTGAGAGSAAPLDAGALSDASSSGSSGDSGDGHPEPDAAAPCVRGTVSGSQLVFIGDSFIAAPTSNIAFELQALLEASGSTAYSPTPRFRQLVGATMEQIVAQYDTEHALDPDIKVVIGNGGGNDVLVTDRSCLLEAPPANEGCAATIDNALDHARALMAKAEADGVEHFVYFFYPHEPTSGLFQGEAPAINDSLDYAEPLARAVCEASPICTFVSLSEAAGDSPGSGYVDRGYHDLDGTHPSPEGSMFFAGAIWEAMVEGCIAQ